MFRLERALFYFTEYLHKSRLPMPAAGIRSANACAPKFCR